MGLETHIAIVGTGDVVLNRYVRGLSAAREHGLPVVVEQVFGLASIMEVQPLLQALGLAVQAYKVLPAEPEAAAAYIHQHLSSDVLPVLAVPTDLHVPLASRLIRAGRRVVIEKPLTTDAGEFALLDTDPTLSGLFNWFPLAYYLLEKGLPLAALMCASLRQPAVLDLLHPRVSPHVLEGWCRELGAVQGLEACLLEGAGTAAVLDHRPWVLTRSGGGNTWETMFHLFSMMALIPGGDMTLLDSSRGCVTPAGMTGGALASPYADTAHYVKARIGSVDCSLLTAKAVSPQAHQRWARLRTHGGEVFMDFESCTLSADLPSGRVQLALKDRRPYWAQFALVHAWHERRYAPPREIYRRGFRFTSQAWSAGATQTCLAYPHGADLDLLGYCLGRPLGDCFRR